MRLLLTCNSMDADAYLKAWLVVQVMVPVSLMVFPEFPVEFGIVGRSACFLE